MELSNLQDKIKQPFIIQTQQLRTEGNILNLEHFLKPRVNIILMEKY